MKLINQFKEFLNDVVNLNDTRINLLDDSVEAIKKFIRDSDWTPKLIEFVEHGSWAHGTIIKPLEGRPFDADLVVFVELVDGWGAKDYVDELGKVFRASGTYEDKIRVWDYCVTVEYAQERKIDIAPCVVGRAAPDSLEVCNRKSNTFEDTNPKEYTRWVKAKNAVIGNHGLPSQRISFAAFDIIYIMRN